jgi:hypothetical protein
MEMVQTRAYEVSDAVMIRLSKHFSVLYGKLGKINVKCYTEAVFEMLQQIKKIMPLISVE